jgi:1-acyl-sn-glycerol-3-phosphate acyltransferase
LGQKSSVERDSKLLLRGANPPPRVSNADNIPTQSSFILTVNHYDRPGLAAWWGAATIICAVASRRDGHDGVHFAIAREWWYAGGLGRAIKQPLTRWFFARIANAYDMIPLPPVLGNNAFRGQGALAVRHAVAWTRGEDPRIVGLAPEGRTGDNLSLCNPPTGAGLLLLLLAHDALPILPAGIYEDESQTLTVNFGSPYVLSVPRDLSRQLRDEQAARRAMVEIGRLLPERMWGVFREDIRGAI